MPVLSALLNTYPHLQALSASSPIWAGLDTGYASNRALMFQQLPTAGLPFQFATWPEFEAYVQDQLDHRRDRRALRDPLGHPPVGPPRHHREPGLRRRLRPARAGRARRAHALPGRRPRHPLAAGEKLPTMPPWHVQENKWRAARYGLDAIDHPRRGARNERLVTDDLADLLERLAPVAGGSAARPSCARSRTSRGGVRRTSGSGRSPSATGGDLVAVVDSVVRELRDVTPLQRLGCGLASSRGGRRAAGPAGRARPGRAANRRVGEHARVVGGRRQGEAAGDREERLEPHLDADPRGRAALAVDVLDHRRGQRADRLRRPRPSRRGPPGRSPRARARAAPTASRRPGWCRRRGRAGGTTAPSSDRARAASTRASECGELAHGVDAERRELLRGLGADPPQRVGGPVAHHLEPVLLGQPAGPARLAEVGGDLGPQLVVADPDRAVQPGRASTAARISSAKRAGRRGRRGPARPRGTPRPSRAPRAPPARRPTPATAAWPSPRAEAASYAGPSTGRNTASGHLRCGDPQRHAGADAELAGRVRRRRHHAALGRVAAAADDHRQALQLGVPQHLDRRDELVEVDVQHPLLAAGVSRPRLVDACRGRPV